MTVTSVVFLAAFVVALAGFAFFVTRRVRYVLLGQPEDRSDQLGRRTSGFVVYVLGQKKLFKEPVGILHFFIFWGFIVIAFGALQIIGQGLSTSFSLPLIGGWPVFYLLQDLFIVLVIVAVIAAAIYRYVVRPERLEASLEAGVILALILGIMVAALLYSGLEYALHNPDSHSLAPVTHAAASIAQRAGWSGNALQNGAWVFWWAHVVFMLAFLVYIPLSKHLHLLACPVNEFFRNLKPAGGQIRPLDLEDEDVEEYGVSRIEGFTHWQLLDLYACAECGRCQDHCPAHLSGKSLSPKTLMTKLKDHLNERGPVLAKTRADGGDQSADAASPVSMIGDVISEDEIWACTTCGSCQEQCPVLIEHVNKIVDMRRTRSRRGRLPRGGAARLLQEHRDPGQPLGHRLEPARRVVRGPGRPAGRRRAQVFEWLFLVGCAGAFDDRAEEGLPRHREDPAGGRGEVRHPRTTRRPATARPRGAARQRVPLPDAGHRQRRDSERLRGEEGRRPVPALPEHDQERVPRVRRHLRGGAPHRAHRRAGRGRPAALCERVHGPHVTFHDPCYLARWSGVTDEPREALGAVPGLRVLEMARNREQGFCCGAGGGRMWLEEEAGKRVNELRVGQLLETSPDVIGVNCPYCLTMMEDGLGSVAPDNAVRVLDLAEILAERLVAQPSAGEPESN